MYENVELYLDFHSSFQVVRRFFIDTNCRAGSNYTRLFDPSLLNAGPLKTTSNTKKRQMLDSLSPTVCVYSLQTGLTLVGLKLY